MFNAISGLFNEKDKKIDLKAYRRVISPLQSIQIKIEYSLKPNKNYFYHVLNLKKCNCQL